MAQLGRLTAATSFSHRAGPGSRLCGALTLPAGHLNASKVWEHPRSSLLSPQQATVSPTPVPRADSVFGPSALRTRRTPTIHRNLCLRQRVALDFPIFLPTEQKLFLSPGSQAMRRSGRPTVMAPTQSNLLFSRENLGPLTGPTMAVWSLSITAQGSTARSTSPIIPAAIREFFRPTPPPTTLYQVGLATAAGFTSLLAGAVNPSRCGKLIIRRAAQSSSRKMVVPSQSRVPTDFSTILSL